jgi:hypothetical protein
MIFLYKGTYSSILLMKEGKRSFVVDAFDGGKNCSKLACVRVCDVKFESIGSIKLRIF